MSGLPNWSPLVPSLDDRAVAPGKSPERPTVVESPYATGTTFIEAPYRLMLSPTTSLGWTHAREPRDHGPCYTELWHTRLSAMRSLSGEEAAGD
jgi:hypothetical protein